MTEPVTLAEARLFLRVGDGAEDGVIQTLIDAARARVEAETGRALDGASPAPLRLAVMMLAMRAYERGEADETVAPVEGWIAPYRTVRL
ncbi:head-tail connector protein [Brevundimonas faecalis]|uniref:Phage gp6-like head-tail connector protein n=1 Tax=Brevundimonas faecalis TaxID=947378 RepID=A0ABV2R8F5_9CAUL